MNDNLPFLSPSEMRKRAEDALRSKPHETLEKLTPEAHRVIIHELRVHQIQLEMQNEELRRTQSELETLKASYFDLYELAPAGYCTLSAKGLLVQSNLTAATLLGLKRGSLNQPPFNRFIAKEDQDAFYLLRKTALDTGVPQQGELRMVKTDGTPFWGQLEINAKPDTDGSHDLLIVFSDISDRKKREGEDIRNLHLERAAQQSRRLESLASMSAGIAHDFNNIFGSISGAADLLELSAPADSATRKKTDIIRSGIQRAATLTNSMLDFAGTQRRMPAPVSVSDLIAGYEGELRAALVKGGLMRLELEPDLTPVMADADQIRLLVTNLVTNASEACQGTDGEVVIKTGLRRAFTPMSDEGAGLSASPHGDYVCLEVVDTGCGMDEATRARIFDPFYSTKFIGRGLGLAAVLGIVRAHKGVIATKSKIGAGSTVTICFPLSVESAAPPPGPVAPEPDGKRRRAVLIVEDDESLSETLSLFMEMQGFEVVSANDGKPGVEFFKADPHKFDFVLMDLTMPAMDGDLAFAEMKKIRGNADIIMMSGYAEDLISKRLRGGKPLAYLKKPFPLEELLGVIQRADGRPSPRLTSPA